MIITDDIKKGIAKLATTHRLDLVVLFGSQATGRTHNESDVDIAVLSRDLIDKARIAVELDKIFNRDDTEVVNLSNASPVLMRAVVNEGKLLFERTVGDFFHWKMYAIRVWMETAWLRVLGRKKLVEWAEQL